MATITASLVNELRSRTSLPMMKCKQLLTAADGDLEKAFDAARKEGVKASIAERAATEGRVAAGASADHKTAAAVEINCNTDFTAKSDTVQKIIDAAVAKLLANPSLDLTTDADTKAALTAVSQQTGENVILGKTSVVTSTGVAGAYLYSTAGKGKIAVLVGLSGSGASEELVRLIGMHAAAARPIALTRDEVPAEIVAKEKEIAVEQAKASGKPAEIAEKIAIGKLNAFYSERVLLDQEFINGEVFKGSIANLVKSKGATLDKYVRIEVGQ